MSRYLIVLLLVTIGCYRPSKTCLTKDELGWISVYKAGDTLVYQSTQGKYDTIFITGSKSYYPEFIPIEVHNEYLPHSGEVLYTHTSLYDSAVNERLVYIVKKAPENRTSLFINFLNTGFISTNVNTIKETEIGRDKLFVLDTNHPKAMGWEPKVIFWSKNWGIVKYITHDNEVWQICNSESGFGRN